MSDPYIGEIKMVAFNYAPRNWAACDGQLIPLQQNPPLFSLLGSMYGGDGQSSFALPDMRGRVPVHRGQNPYSQIRYYQGGFGGYDYMTLGSTQLPYHAHGIVHNLSSKTPANSLEATSNTADAGDTSSLGNTGTASRPGSNLTYNNENPDRTLRPMLLEGDIMVEPFGGSEPFDNRQPYMTVLFAIALDGIYPPRPD